jgi:AraC-like DNA-binding protein
MWETAELCRLLAVGQLMLWAAVLYRDHRADPSATASRRLILAVSAHLLTPTLLARGAPLPLLHLVMIVGLAVPFAFWMTSEIHFDDDFELRPVHGVLLAGLLAVGYVSWLAVVERRLPGPLFAPAHDAFWLTLPKLLGLAFVVHALMTLYVGARSDLVVPRLKLRYMVLGLAGTYILLELVGEAILGGAASQPLADRVHAISVSVLVFGLSFLCFSIRPEVLRPNRPAVDAPALDPALGEKLRMLIEVEQIFREEGLTIAGLAERLGAHEYKVRQLINSQLGFKNFNAFLHHLRVQRAVKLLSDPAQAHLGVAQIAYEVGYRSLGPFNKAFKELIGRTPTEFRATEAGRKLPDSGTSEHFAEVSKTRSRA